jgi:MFS family permease
MKNKKFKNSLNTFYLFMIGQFVSQFGSKLTSYGLILWSYKQSGSVLSMSLLSVCYLVPEVLLSFIAGSISDRWSKKKIMLWADAIAAVFSVSVIFLYMTASLRIEYLYLINFMLGVTDAFQNPASQVTISVIVPKEHYMKTSGLQSFFNSFTGILAPVAATSLYAFCGLQIILMIDLATFVFAFVTLAFFVHIPPITGSDEERHASLFEQCKSGMLYLIQKKDILSLIVFMAFVNLIAAIYNTNLSPMVLSRNGNNDIQLGIVSSTISIAGLIGSVLVTKIPQTSRRIPQNLNIMTFSFIFCNSLLAIGRNYYVWTFAVFMGNLFIPILVANVEYIMRTRTPLELQGRVFSARNTLQYTSIPVGTLLGGYLSDQVFEPFMKKDFVLQSHLSKIVGSSAGSGIALLYLCLGLVGFVGCCIFRFDKNLRRLDEES